MVSSAHILATLDEAAAAYRFPVLDNVEIDLAAIRLTAFRSHDEWLIVFQEIAFAQGFHGFADAITAFGDHLKSQGTQRVVVPVSLAKKADPPSVNAYDFVVRVHGGKARRFTPSADDYRSAHVDADDDSPAGAKILRYLASRIGHELFCSDDTLLKVCGRSSARLKRFIEIDQWHHPDVAGDEKPSDIGCFKSLARALSRGDGKLYRCSPASFNTGWWQWEKL